MNDAKALTDLELCEVAEKWIAQLNYSKGNHYPLLVIGGGGVPSCESVFTELIRRVLTRPQDGEQ